MTAAEALQHNLKKRRKQLRLSQAQVAERATDRSVRKISGPAVSRYESGKLVPTIDTIEALAAALACSASDLCSPEWEPPPLPEGF